MLKRVFGKKTTGIAYIISAVLLLVIEGGAIVTYLLSENRSLPHLIGYTMFIAFALLLITLPVILQKWRKLYIPPSVMVGICLYALLYLAEDALFVVRPQRGLKITFSPMIGGFFIAMTVFSVAYTFFDVRAEKHGRDASAPVVAVVTFFITTALSLLLNLGAFGISYYLLDIPWRRFGDAMLLVAGHAVGTLIFCVYGAVSGAEKFRIRSFRDADLVKNLALEQENKSMYAVVDNISNDTTDYKKLYRKAKLHFYSLRVFYIVLYAAYTAHALYTFIRSGGIGYAISACLLVSFALSSAVYIYELRLFRQNALNQRLRRLKIIKSVSRIYTLALLLAAMFVADYTYNEITALTSVILAIFNLCVLFYNIFGKPKHYLGRHEDPDGQPAESAEA